jgi:glutamyl-tRNA reductase
MLTVLGASHHDLELTQLERLAARTEELSSGLAALSAREDSPVAGLVLVSTCNRLEIYLHALRFHDAIDAVGEVVAETAGMRTEDVVALLKVRVGAPVAAHLFSVTAGLDSMVVGEAEIAGQVARAFRDAQTARTTSAPINLLFQAAARTAKRVATVTGLGAAGRSVASVALDIALADPLDDDVGALANNAGAGAARAASTLAGARALVIGTGAYARVVAAELRARECSDLSVFSPSGRAPAFAIRHDAAVVLPEDLFAALTAADLVVTCSGSSAPTLDEVLLKDVVAQRDRPLPVIDLALRSDLSPGARTVPGVRLVDLYTVAEQADPAHRDAVTDAQDVVIAAVADFEDQLAQRRIDPAVVALRQHISAAVEKEVTRLRAKYPADIASDVELALHRVTQSLLHTPTLRAKELARTGDSADYVQALHTLFGIDISQAAPAADGKQNTGHPA